MPRRGQDLGVCWRLAGATLLVSVLGAVSAKADDRATQGGVMERAQRLERARGADGLLDRLRREQARSTEPGAPAKPAPSPPPEVSVAKPTAPKEAPAPKATPEAKPPVIAAKPEPKPAAPEPVAKPAPAPKPAIAEPPAKPAAEPPRVALNPEPRPTPEASPAPPTPRPPEPARAPEPPKADPKTELAGRVAALTDRDRLLKLVADEPAARELVAARLAALGYLRVAGGAGPERWLKPGGGEVFRDCPDCPQMLVIPAGSFLLGSPASEVGRGDDEDDATGAGGKPVSMRIARPFAIGRTEVTRGEYMAFVEATRHDSSGGCYGRYGTWQLVAENSWARPGFEQDDSHPVVCVSWHDARAYATWLSRKTGTTYRLLSEAEWEFAARALAEPGASQPPYSFGGTTDQLCAHANGADLTARQANPGWNTSSCTDGYRWTAPVGRFKSNAFGLHDMHGNVWEWVEDCFHESYQGMPEPLRTTGAPWSDKCPADGMRVLRGGSWSDPPASLRSARRIAGPPTIRDEIAGFRVARQIER